MYKYVSKEERDSLAKACEDIILNVQKSVKEYFTFEYRLIGSGEKRLITRNGESGPFDLDFNFILKKDKKELSSFPEKIKNIFINAFNEVNPEFNFKFASNSTSVIASKLVLNGEQKFSFDVAIMIEGNNGNLYKLIFDKTSGRYLWNEVRKTKNYGVKFKRIKEEGYWEDFKERYLHNKNLHLTRNEETPSFSVFLETLNEYFQ
ncbi:MAG: hypothetical protein KKH01_07155 [Firmicutes bacterium]|nr:hypothetical protein [Bacillota bacterium]